MNEVRNELQKSYGTGYNDGYSKGYEDGCADRPQGEWIETSEGTMCGNCHRFPYDDGEYHIANWRSEFCPNCGAKMKGAIEVSEDKEIETERLDFVKKIIETHIDDALCGIYFTRNIVGDQMIHLDKQFGIDIEICYEHEYFEIFGLTDSEQKTIESFYDELNTRRQNK